MKIVSFYDIPKYEDEHRVFAPSAVTVIDYLCGCCQEFHEPVEIISAAETRNLKGKCPFRSEKISKGVRLTQAKSFGHRNRLFREVGKVKSRLWLVWYLLKYTKKDETVFFWDSPVLYEPLFLFRAFSKFKRVKILYFATELFQEVLSFNCLKKRMEWKLFETADKLVVTTEQLNGKVNRNNRPYIILHGVYKPAPLYGRRFQDGRRHIVYAGIINKKKGSGQAVGMAKYLDGSYHIHVLGYGTENEIRRLQKNIELSNKQNDCKVSYEGVLSGEVYNEFLQKCDIGLCSQNLNEKYNDSSFPSKILTYLANGLRVISVDLKAIRTSQVGKLLYYSKSDSPKDLADAVMGIDYSQQYDSRSFLVGLHKKFSEEFEQLIRK
jgi:glycosyltransferase involved in cell wall biosynthesis